MITAIPEGGLCNRMRVVASCLELARRTGHALQVHWYRTPDFNARFDEVFDTRALPFAVRPGDAMQRWQRAGIKLHTALRRGLGGAVYTTAQGAGPGAFESAQAQQQVQAARQVRIHTNARLITVPGMYGCFAPGAQVAQRLQPLLPGLRDSVAVHVRRTDNAQAIAQSPLQVFVDLMQQAVQRQPDVRLFVATDEPQVLADFRQHFGDRVWSYEKRAYRRDDPTAIVDAAVDLYALAHCRSLIGSHWSSFTDTAAELRDIPLVIARQLA